MGCLCIVIFSLTDQIIKQDKKSAIERMCKYYVVTMFSRRYPLSWATYVVNEGG